MIKPAYPKRLSATLFLLINSQAYSVEHDFKGLVDIRAYSVDGINNSESYIAGNYGKFGSDQGTGLSLAQLGLEYQAHWDNNISAKVVANGYLGGVEHGDNSAFGLTEAYLKYRGLPNQDGWRFSGKTGFFYPNISMENIATAWSTPFTLTSSTLNTWIGEEMRSTGIEFSIEKLGKFNQSDHNFSADISLFKNNDTLGAMLAWHGWTQSSRQTLLNEKLIVQPFPALEGDLQDQAAQSDPFIELDGRVGFHVVGHWRFKNKLKANLGYYDNNADPRIVKNGQYTWPTRFTHLGLKAKIYKNTEVISQYMTGNSYMQSPSDSKVVEIDFDNTFVMLRHYWSEHHVAMRVEYFSTDDLDQTIGDNNNETGKGFTTSYRYKLSPQSFIQMEYNWINSKRASRSYMLQPINAIEKQWLLSYRYYL